VTLDLSDDDHLALKLAAAHQRSSMAELLRALVALWRSDPDLAERVRTYLAGRGPR
jgi:hypothetical protein